MGFDISDQMMQMLLDHCSNFLTGRYKIQAVVVCRKILSFFLVYLTVLYLLCLFQVSIRLVSKLSALSSFWCW